MVQKSTREPAQDREEKDFSDERLPEEIMLARDSPEQL